MESAESRMRRRACPAPPQASILPLPEGAPDAPLACQAMFQAMSPDMAQALPARACGILDRAVAAPLLYSK
jgi:hypothetical protein